MVKINDVWACAYLLSHGIPIQGVRATGTNGKRSVYFTFAGAKAERLHQAFIAGNATVNVIRMKATMIHVKNLLFNELRKKETERNEITHHQQNHYRQSATG